MVGRGSKRLHEANLRIQEGLRTSPTFTLNTPYSNVSEGIKRYHGMGNFVTVIPGKDSGLDVIVTRRNLEDASL